MLCCATRCALRLSPVYRCNVRALSLSLCSTNVADLDKAGSDSSGNDIKGGAYNTIAVSAN